MKMPRQINKFIDSLKTDVEYQIGKDAKDNIDMLAASQQNDIWFHIDGESSCHVIAKVHDLAITNKKQAAHIIKQGAVLCKQFSKYKSLKDVSIIYTKVGNVCPTEKVGQVITTNTKTVVI
jgi:predicted ribosome quality control (RQC) complex YloA/Tae2 family protein